MVAASIIGRVFRHEMDSDGSAWATTGVCARAMPSEGVMKMHVPLLDWTHNRIDWLALKGIGGC